ncbi:MAG: hypothetical protein ACD_79C00487G0002 [uncultured bacterium]|nr:MAG: hypothetical protein ACD_79C00487G0002 [uncultured bacterium]
MGKPTGFLEFDRENSGYRPVTERLKDYKDVVSYLPDEKIETQASRCMDCGIPFCHSSGCPVYNLIPEWNDLIYRGKWKEAFQKLDMTNNLPEITGRICPAPCETACTLSINSAPVTIRQIELAIIEKAFKNGWVQAKPPISETGKKIAVIGSGPAGLSAAIELRKNGHSVTVFEKNRKIGGILRYGIPDFKLEKWILDRRIDLMKKEGIIFETEVNIGEDISAKYLKKSFDIILITMGAGEPRDIKVPGRELKGIHFAMEYLTMSNDYVAGLISEKDIIYAKGKNVLVIGGGDTGSDCVGTANRQGAKKVYQYEIMPMPPKHDAQTNPSWPNWPTILRKSSSHEEGCERDWNVLTKQFLGKNRLEKAQFSKIQWDKQQFKEIPGSEFSIDVDLVFLAMGFVHVEHNKLLADLGVLYDERGNIKMRNNSNQTNKDGIYVAGDASLGASLIVRAIFQGRTAASEINNVFE